MLTPPCFALSWVSGLTLLAPLVPSHSVSSVARIAPFVAAPLTAPVTLVDTRGDTGSAPAFTRGLLTPDLVTPYAAVEKALDVYWAAHPDQAKHAQQDAKGVNIQVSQGVSTGWSIPNYPVLVQQDTAVAAIFTQYHFVPTQFVPTMAAVRNAISAVLQHASVDSATVTGKNMAFVQAHRSELATDWSAMQMDNQMGQDLLNMLFKRGQDTSGRAP